MKALLVFVACITFLLPNTLYAEEELNAGFVKGLWYSTPVVFAGEPVRIYVALRNHTDRDLTGTVRFSANGKRIGIAYVSALPGRIVEAWTDWTPSFGEYTITASLTEVRFHELGENPETAEVISMLAEDKLVVDYDTDKDGVGNTDDTDDDGDDISDEDEIKNGTNPLIPNPKDKDNKANSETNSTDSEEGDDNSSAERTTTTTSSQTTKPTGLERFTPDGAVDSVITTVTDRINETRDSLDTYRTTKLPAPIPFLAEDEPVASAPVEGTLSSSTLTLSSQPLVTITRERIESESNGFLAKAWSTTKNVALGLYALGLWLLSKLLSHPALVQILFLLLIILIIYKTARKLGRRPARD